MSQQRLNHTSVGNVHRNLLDEVDVPALAKEFAEKTKIRRRIFGNFKNSASCPITFTIVTLQHSY